MKPLCLERSCIVTEPVTFDELAELIKPAVEASVQAANSSDYTLEELHWKLIRTPKSKVYVVKGGKLEPYPLEGDEAGYVWEGRAWFKYNQATLNPLYDVEISDGRRRLAWYTIPDAVINSEQVAKEKWTCRFYIDELDWPDVAQHYQDQLIMRIMKNQSPVPAHVYKWIKGEENIESS